jgi:type IX secretion system PorP/SprF family membrane protein
MKKLLTITAALLLSGGALRAQDIHFSQFYENSILRNPGLTGIFSGDYKAGVNYRTQWGSIANPFQTVIASYESRILVNKELHDYLSYGLCVSYDHAGSIDFNSIQVTPALNYNKSLYDRHQSYLSVGFAGSYIQRSVDPSKMTLDNQWVNGGYINTAPTGENMTFQKITHYDVSAGVSFNSAAGANNEVIYYIGGAAYHIMRPRESFNPNEAFIRLNPKYTGSAGLSARLTPSFGLSVMANYTNQNPYVETMFGGLASYRHTMGENRSFAIYAGCFVRVNDAIIPTIKVDYNKYSFTASYDVTTSSLKPSLSSQGGYEFSVYIRGKRARNADQLDQVNCPRFEQDMNPQFD